MSPICACDASSSWPRSILFHGTTCPIQYTIIITNWPATGDISPNSNPESAFYFTSSTWCNRRVSTERVLSLTFRTSLAILLLSIFPDSSMHGNLLGRRTNTCHRDGQQELAAPTSSYASLQGRSEALSRVIFSSSKAVEQSTNAIDS